MLINILSNIHTQDKLAKGKIGRPSSVASRELFDGAMSFASLLPQDVFLVLVVEVHTSG